MPKAIDLSGMVFSRLTVIAREPATGHRNVMWRCRCECGTFKVISSIRLRRGETKSCGCLKIEQFVERRWKHGASHTQEYYRWQGMKARCNDPKNKAFHRYGGRGIVVCEAWMKSFDRFRSDMGPRPSNHTLERIDPDGNYEPSNCKWATWTEQRNNRSSQREAA